MVGAVNPGGANPGGASRVPVAGPVTGRAGPLLVLYACLAALACLSAQPPAPTLLTAVLVAVVAVAVTRLTLRPRGSAGGPARIRAVSLRSRAAGTAYLPVCAPDAAGRPRPRAPAVRPPAARQPAHR